jgi:hypothetical protein
MSAAKSGLQEKIKVLRVFLVLHEVLYVIKYPAWASGQAVCTDTTEKCFPLEFFE